MSTPRRVADIFAGAAGSNPNKLTAVGKTLFFSAEDGSSGRELWRSDGTSIGTTRVADLSAGSASSAPSQLTAAGSALFFTADDGKNGVELWTSDGTSEGTILLTDSYPNSEGSNDLYPRQLSAIGDTLFFSHFPKNDPWSGVELWKSDGTSSGTGLVKDIDNTFGSYPGRLTKAGNTLFFSASNLGIGGELWKTDGTGFGTRIVSNINSHGGTYFDYGSYPHFLTAVGNALFFTANDGNFGQELWMSKGTRYDTMLVKDINTLNNDDSYYNLYGADSPPNASSSPSNLMAVGELIFFSANDGINGRELWKSDGTSAGTSLVADINPGENNSVPSSLVAAGNTLFFVADDGVNGKELWKSDGTTTGTTRVADIHPGSTGSDPSSLVAVGSTLFFSADDGIHGRELWKSDGTTTGTTRVTDIHPGSTGSNPSSLVLVGNTLFFSADDANSGNELWALDITTSLPVITLAVEPTSVVEDGTSNLIFTFTRNGSTISPLTVDYTVSGTAILGSDYTGINKAGITKNVTFDAGSTTASITVKPTVDQKTESDETVTLTLIAGIGYQVATTSSASGKILNDDSSFSIKAVDAVKAEGNHGSTAFTFAVTRKGNLSTPAIVNYRVESPMLTGVVDGKETANAQDFVEGIFPSGTLSFLAGERRKVLTVNIQGDGDVEVEGNFPSDDIFLVTLSEATGGATVALGSATGVILNDDTEIHLSLASPATVNEDGTSNLKYNFTRTGVTTNALKVNYTVAGSARRGVDYSGIPSSKTVTFAAGSASASVSVDPTADTRAESNETISLTLASGTGYTIGTTTAVTGTIRNDDIIGTDINNTLIGTTLADYIYGAGGSDKLTGDGGTDRLDGGPGADILTGGNGVDTFLFRWRHSRLGTPDRLTDFAIGIDKIDILSATGVTLPAPVGFSRASNNAASSLSTVVAAVFTDANGGTSGNQPLATNSAALVVATSPAIAGTYLVINDAVAGFQSSNDLVVNVSGYTGALPALGSIPINKWFV